MRKQWFGDARDYVKWNFIFTESQPDYVVCYIAMARPDEIATHINPAVKAFFDKYKNLELAGEMFAGRFRTLLREYRARDSDAYFDEVKTLIIATQPSGKVVIFADPDTGVEPRGRATDKHIRLSDVHRIARLLRNGDKLIIYQHAPIMRRPTWIQDSMDRILAENWSGSFRLRHHFDLPCASDVFFLVLER